MAKNISKSIRLSDDLYEMIDNYNGTGFNEKFENIILYAMESEKNRVEKLLFLDEQVRIKETELQDLSKKYKEYSDMTYRIYNNLRDLSNLIGS